MKFNKPIVIKAKKSTMFDYDRMEKFYPKESDIIKEIRQTGSIKVIRKF